MRQTDVDQLSQKLAEYENKLGEMRDVLLRERAEIENQRKRLQRDLEQARKFANERLLGDLLPVCDSLERGLAVDNADIAALREGMDLTLKALLKVAESNGLKPIDPLGQPFDPERHQAMTHGRCAGQGAEHRGRGDAEGLCAERTAAAPGAGGDREGAGRLN